MRQRNIKNLDQKIEANSSFLVEDPRSLKGKWHEHFGNTNPIYLEIGCGKGKFITTLSEKNRDRNYIACEGQANVCVRALEKAEEKGLDNLRVFIDFIHDLKDYFEEGELEGIYLNFSDPWPKERHAKRRLTYHKNINNYYEVIKKGGLIEFKTDNDKLFEFTLEEIELADCEILEMSRDLHAVECEFESKYITTEYEDKFSALGKDINYVKFKKRQEETHMIFAAQNGRVVPKEDRIFGISNRANAMIAKEGKDKVVNATIGALLDDEGNLIVLSSVDEVFRNLKPTEYASYAPISGIPEFREAIQKAAFGNYVPKGYTAAVASPGGTGALRNSIANYSEPGDKVLIADWYWAPYNTIAKEIGRSTETFEFFTEDGKFNVASFKEKMEAILATQERVVTIINTPAHNPTGYSLTEEDWKNVCEVLASQPKEKKITLVVDVAYIDFAGDEDEVRFFLPILETLPENVLPLLAYSLSKTCTLYGMRCGALVCMAKTEEIADEFKRICEVSSRGSWSNCARAPQTIISKIYADSDLKARVDKERADFRDMLIRRGKAIEAASKACGLKMVPFDTGFFASIPVSDPDAVSAELEKEGIFLVPLAKGVRVSVASVSEEVCKMLPEKILAAIKRVGCKNE